MRQFGWVHLLVAIFSVYNTEHVDIGERQNNVPKLLERFAMLQAVLPLRLVGILYHMKIKIIFVYCSIGIQTAANEMPILPNRT